MPYIVYQITNTVNNKRYIGYSENSLEDRWKGHLKRVRLKSKYKFHNAIRKYGAEVFVREVIYTEETLAGAKETEILAILDRNPEYNSTLGGDGVQGYKYTDEDREKIRQNTPVKRGEEHPMFGRKRPDTADRNRKNSGKPAWNKGLPSDQQPMFGRNHSEETKLKQSEVQLGKEFSDEHREKLSASASRRANTEEGRRNSSEAGRKGAEIRWARYRASKAAQQDSEG
jgi:group I intron endonuclease